MTWYLVAWNLVVPDILLEGLVDYLENIEYPGVKLVVDPVEDIVIDYPGIYSTTRNEHIFVLEGLKVRIPSTDFRGLFRELQGLSEGSEWGEPHYRLYGAFRALVMTPSYRESLLRLMVVDLRKAIEIADFENQILNKAFASVENDTNIRLTKREVIDREIPES